MGLDNARIKALDLYQEAVDALHMLSAKSYDTSALKALARFVIERDK